MRHFVTKKKFDLTTPRSTFESTFSNVENLLTNSILRIKC